MPAAGRHAKFPREIALLPDLHSLNLSVWQIQIRWLWEDDEMGIVTAMLVPC